MTNAEAKRIRDAEKRQNAYNISRKEYLAATEKQYDTYRYNSITIVMEDDGYAFEYVRNLLSKTYKFLNINLIGAHGEGNVHHLISFVNTEFMMVIYDKSTNIKLLNKIENEINNFKRRTHNSKVIKIYPKAFEEIILSYIEIDNILEINSKLGEQLLNTIKDYVTGKISDYSLSNYVLNTNRLSDDMILEDWVELLTTKSEYYCTHKPSKISTCWMDDCTEQCLNISNTCHKIMITPIKYYTARSKIEYIALNSLAYKIIESIDNYIGDRFRTTNCNLLNNETIVKEI